VFSEKHIGKHRSFSIEQKLQLSIIFVLLRFCSQTRKQKQRKTRAAGGVEKYSSSIYIVQGTEKHLAFLIGKHYDFPLLLSFLCFSLPSYGKKYHRFTSLLDEYNCRSVNRVKKSCGVKPAFNKSFYHSVGGCAKSNTLAYSLLTVGNSDAWDLHNIYPM
jgi:hypothetical protein